MVYRAYDAVDRRLGCCYVNHMYLRNKESYEKVLSAFRQLSMFILRCEHLWHKDSFEYIFMSPYIREIAEEEKIPVYSLEFLTNKEDRDKQYHQLTEVKGS